MELKTRYERAKKDLLTDSKICRANRDLFKRFFEFEEYKLKRKNGLPALDASCYKTLLAYTSRLRTVNRWFGNKPRKDLTKSAKSKNQEAGHPFVIRSRYQSNNCFLIRRCDEPVCD